MVVVCWILITLGFGHLEWQPSHGNQYSPWHHLNWPENQARRTTRSDWELPPWYGSQSKPTGLGVPHLLPCLLWALTFRAIDCLLVKQSDSELAKILGVLFLRLHMETDLWTLSLTLSWHTTYPKRPNVFSVAEMGTTWEAVFNEISVCTKEGGLNYILNV